MIIINIFFCLFAAIAILNLIRNNDFAARMDNGTQMPDVHLMNCADGCALEPMQRLMIKLGTYSIWALGIGAGALFYIFAKSGWGGMVAAVAGTANVFAIRNVLSATRRLMERFAD